MLDATPAIVSLALFFQTSEIKGFFHVFQAHKMQKTGNDSVLLKLIVYMQIQLENDCNLKLMSNKISLIVLGFVYKC